MSLQEELNKLNLLEEVEEEFQAGYVYAIYPDNEQRQYIHCNCGCERQLHNLFVEELYRYLEGIGFELGQIPGDFVKNLATTKSFKARFSYMKEVDSLALSAVRLDFISSIRKYNKEYVPKGNQYKKRALKQVKTIGKELTYRNLKGMPKFSAKYFSEQSFTTNNQNGTVRLEDYDGESNRYKMLIIPKLKTPIKLRYHREIPDGGRITKAVVKRIGRDRYSVSLTVVFKRKHMTLKHDKEAFDSDLMELNRMIATKEDGALAYALLLSAMDAMRIEKEAEDAVRANEKKIQAAAWMRRYVYFKNGKWVIFKNYNKENYKYKNRLRELRIANGFTSMQALCDHMRDVMGYKISKSVIEKLERHEKEDAQM